MKLRTRPRTAHRSTRSSRGVGIPEGMVRCDLCRRPVPAGPEGRCVLGHRLPVPAHAPRAPQPPLRSEAPVAPESEETEGPVAAASESSAQDYLAQLGDLAGWEASAPAAAVAASPVPRQQDAAVDDTDDPLAWLERFAAPAAAPAPSAPVVPEPGSLADDQPDGDVADVPPAAGAAADVAPPEDGDDNDGEPADSGASEDAWSQLRAEEEAAQDARMVRRQRVAVITGGAIFGVLTFGAVALTLVA